MEEILSLHWGKILTLVSIFVGGIGIFLRYIDARMKAISNWLRASDAAAMSFRDEISRNVEHISASVSDMQMEIGHLAKIIGELQGHQSSLIRQDDCRKLHDAVQERVHRLEQGQSMLGAKLLTAKCVASQSSI